MIGTKKIPPIRTVLLFTKSLVLRKEDLLGRCCAAGWVLILGAVFSWSGGCCGNGSTIKNCAVGSGLETEGGKFRGADCDSTFGVSSSKLMDEGFWGAGIQ